MPRSKKKYYEIIINVCIFCGFEEENVRTEHQLKWNNTKHQEIDASTCTRCVTCMPNAIQRKWIEDVIAIATFNLRSQTDRLETRLDRLGDI